MYIIYQAAQSTGVEFHLSSGSCHLFCPRPCSVYLYGTNFVDFGRLQLVGRVPRHSLYTTIIECCHNVQESLKRTVRAFDTHSKIPLERRMLLGDLWEAPNTIA